THVKLIVDKHYGSKVHVIVQYASSPYNMQCAPYELRVTAALGGSGLKATSSFGFTAVSRYGVHVRNTIENCHEDNVNSVGAIVDICVNYLYILDDKYVFDKLHRKLWKEAIPYGKM